ncbi:MAG: hypothetical protein C0603_01260 [Denitrovibrio sp.]|nr:MAG: hypothetical protein C0603_01260 [Denitrovibrio sp.]
MTRHFSKWIAKQDISETELTKALDEVISGNYEASLGGSIFKKRVRFENTGKSGSGRTIICYKKGNNAIYIHGFAKNEKDNLSKNELIAFKELAKIIFNMTDEQITSAIYAGKFMEIE